jgi:NAD(P)-dependent dehydrogenase (short-subunit alcohol dehydrogenase family)
MNIIVNGATRGIGKEIALLFAGTKSNIVLITGRNGTVLKQISGGAKYGNILPFEMDLSDFDNYKDEFIKVVVRNFKSIDILINCAGMLVSEVFLKFDNKEARKMMETNFFGPASVIRILQPHMPAGSHIVNISSMGGFQGSSKYRGLSYYSASKAALSCLSECLAEEYREMGIVVNCLALGAVQTEMFNEAFPAHKAPVTAAEMAGFIVDFAVNGSRFFNGKVIPVALNNP